MRAGVKRWAAAAAVMLLGAPAIASQGLDHFVGRIDPVRALEWGARGAVTYGRASQALLEDAAEPAARARAEKYARIALTRDATAIPGWNALASLRAAKGDTGGAESMLLALGGLAQRDLPAQLLLINGAVRSGDIPGALRHYDIALRTAEASDDLLLPVLVEATRAPLVARPLAGLLQRRPNWERPFLGRLAEAAPDDDRLADLLVRTYQADRASQDLPLMNIARRMASDGSAEPAWRLFRTVDPAGARTLLRDPTFAKAGPWPPFYWSLPGDGPVTSLIRTNQGAGRRRALEIRVGSDAGGEAARQMMALPAGSYRLAATASRVNDEQMAPVQIRIVCVGAETPLISARPAAPVVFDIARGCPFQLLLVHASAAPRAGSSAVLLERIAIAPQTAG